ncbi:protein translocase subunit SecD [Miltoncostaea marina]|uniref:protein translocase subunit SecD n=1 Tax=Miltoncostaea marina TaxID=2843215 RepID=UPI001C3D836F|nr:protein translocase subunit SecD [Miltoncostaea marina]
MRRPLLLIVLVLGLLAGSVVAIALKPAVLGLDLQGGVEVVLQGQPTEESEVTDEAIERSVEIIRSRVDSFGVAEPEIQTQGDDQILVALPGAEDPEQVVSDLIQPAQLTFINFQRYVVDEGGTDSLYEAVQLARRTEPQSDRGKPAFYAFDADNQPVPDVQQGAPERRLLRESFPDDTFPEGVKVLAVPKGFFLAYEETQRLQTRDAGTQRTWYVFHNVPGLTGRDVTEARSQFQTGGLGSRQRVVTLQFTDEGRQKFADITRELAQAGRVVGQNQSFAIILDGQIVSNPTIDYQDLPTGIDGRNGAQIEGDFSEEEASRLAKQINSGALPIDLEVISLKEVGATLGEESLQQALVAGLVGLVLVILFLIAYYRFLGVIASLALLIYGAFLYAVAVLVPITLTLPGIAGIILTIGVASDANVVIFERVREEARAGKTPRAAILAGYRKGISAIIDANVVTLATAAILFLFTTSGVKGFAFTLFIGVILSLFTAVVATRAVFNALAETRFLRDDRFMALNQREPRWKFDVVGRWKLWMAISFVPLAIGSVWIGINGLNLGLDFESGTRITTSFERQPGEDQVRDVFARLGYDAKIQATSEQVDGREVLGFQMQTETLQPDQQRELRRALDAEFGIDPATIQVETVGPTFGEQIIRNAIWAILLSFAIIVAYLTIRFEYKLALPAILTVVHDVWLSIAIYSFTGREITSATVAALLTILGYSLYDVVIVFDRIRENVPILRKLTYRQVVNTSLHEVLNRTIITQITTLLPLFVLYFFGGETLQDFAFALLVGILSGGLSSIGIAAPLVALWKEREPEQRRRSAKAERRQAVIAGDADVVDLVALERAEQALAAEIRAEEGVDDDEAEEYEELPMGDEEPATGEERPPEPGRAPGDELEEDKPPRRIPATAGDGDGDGDGDADGDGTPREPARTRARPDPARPRRHRNVQRRRRR